VRLHISAFSLCENTRVAREGFAQRNVLGISLEKSSRKCYNDTTIRNFLEIRNAGRIFETKIRAACPASALCGSDKIPKFAKIA
jgi:hypothetical protein